VLDTIVQRFASGQAQALPHEQAVNHVSAMIQEAPREQVFGALSDALSGMDARAFGDSVASAAQNLSQEQRGQLGSLLVGTLSEGGGSGGSILRNLGVSSIDPGTFSPGDLGALASHLHQNNLPGLTGALGAALSGGNFGGTSMGGLGAFGGGGFGTGSGSGVLALLGSPVVRQFGMQLAQRLLPGDRSSLENRL
jgi:hypothetical protein